MKGKAAPWFDSGQAIRVRRGWRNAALGGLLMGLVVSTWFAAMQAPHPDMFRPIGLWDVGRMAWWAHPLERNAFKRQILRGRLNAVFALPGGEHVWAVGEGGLIVHSADGGQTWKQQQPVRQQAPDKSTAAAPARWMDWIPSAQAQGKLPNASNAMGQQQGPPADNAPPVTRASPDAAKKADAARALIAKKLQRAATVSPPASSAAAGTANPLLPAASAAESASSAAVEPLVQSPGPRKVPELHAVFFMKASLGWAVGEAGTVLATRDGGSTWTAQASGSRSWLTGVQFDAGGLDAWVVGNLGTVLATHDGGGTWAPRTVAAALR
jgi:hypothetical protein